MNDYWRGRVNRCGQKPFSAQCKSVGCYDDYVSGDDAVWYRSIGVTNIRHGYWGVAFSRVVILKAKALLVETVPQALTKRGCPSLWPHGFCMI
jgi:hypothetical protein